MPAIYEPTGKAREYGDLACNLYRGCSHGCVYCYAPGILRMKKDVFKRPKPFKGILQRLAPAAKKHRGSETPIFLSFLSDPYQPIEEKLGVTRRALELLTENNCAINILTKGGTRACRDFDILKKNPLNWFGVTLTFAGSISSQHFEPDAAIPTERIRALKEAKHLGINTWISFEPLLRPMSVLPLIKETLGFCDLYKIGKLNHRKDIGPSEDELREFLKEAVALLEENGKQYYIKLDTRPFLEVR